eukprot:gene31500-26900_t
MPPSDYVEYTDLLFTQPQALLLRIVDSGVGTFELSPSLEETRKMLHGCCGDVIDGSKNIQKVEVGLFKAADKAAEIDTDDSSEGESLALLHDDQEGGHGSPGSPGSPEEQHHDPKRLQLKKSQKRKFRRGSKLGDAERTLSMVINSKDDAVIDQALMLRSGALRGTDGWLDACNSLSQIVDANGFGVMTYLQTYNRFTSLLAPSEDVECPFEWELVDFLADKEKNGLREYRAFLERLSTIRADIAELRPRIPLNAFCLEAAEMNAQLDAQVKKMQDMIVREVATVHRRQSN